MGRAWQKAASKSERTQAAAEMTKLVQHQLPLLLFQKITKKIRISGFQPNIYSTAVVEKNMRKIWGTKVKNLFSRDQLSIFGWGKAQKKSNFNNYILLKKMDFSTCHQQIYWDRLKS